MKPAQDEPPSQDDPPRPYDPPRLSSWPYGGNCALGAAVSRRCRRRAVVLVTWRGRAVRERVPLCQQHADEWMQQNECSRNKERTE